VNELSQMIKPNSKLPDILGLNPLLFHWLLCGNLDRLRMKIQEAINPVLPICFVGSVRWIISAAAFTTIEE
jgi:hypothetical protein